MQDPTTHRRDLPRIAPGLTPGFTPGWFPSRQAGRRRYLHLACAHYARELALGEWERAGGREVETGTETETETETEMHADAETESPTRRYRPEKAGEMD